MLVTLLFGAATAAGPASAPAIIPVSEAGGCISAMAKGWPGLVSSIRSKPVIIVPLPQGFSVPSSIDAEDQRALATLEAACAQDPAALADLASLRAGAEIGSDPRRAIALLDAKPIDPTGRLFVRNLWLGMSAGARIGNRMAYNTARDALIAANERGLLATRQWVLVETGTSRTVSFRSYRRAAAQSEWLFVISPHDTKQIASVHARFAEYSSSDDVAFELAHQTCDSSGYIDPGEAEKNPAPTYESVRARITGYFDGTVVPYQNDVGGPLADIAPVCLQTGEVLPGLGRAYEFDGTEYIDATLPPDVETVRVWLQSPDLIKRNKAANFVLDHPDAVDPFGYIHVFMNLLEHGNMRQAAFWYYVFQIRSAPWRDGDPSGAGSLYGSISATVGPTINGWAGSDRDAWLDLMLRAAAFERKAPLYPGRPDGVSKAQWDKRIDQSRKRWSEASLRSSVPDRAKMEAQRRANGLLVGPWQSPGDPLLESWR